MYGSLQELCELEEKSGKPFWKIVQEDDCREQGITEEVSFEQMRAMYQAMKDADARYDEKLKSESGLVGTEGKKMMEARAEGTLLCGDFIGKVMEKALKTSESNACMKRIVAAPTAGSCGVVPAVFLSLQEEKGYSEEKMVEALFVAAGIGGVIAERAFLAGAAGGCQAEIGSAAAMAAPRLCVVVVLATPPFWFAIAITFTMFTPLFTYVIYLRYILYFKYIIYSCYIK